VQFKQNIGHIGVDVVVCGVHGHCRTMKHEWPEQWKHFWDRLALLIRKHSIHFVAGDFNMSLTEVPKQLGKRGIKVDCVAWYPWQRDEQHFRQDEHAGIGAHRLGFESCGIFYIGGKVQVSMPWSLTMIEALTAVAGDDELHVYHSQNAPGQDWNCYRSKKYREKATDKNLHARLHDLLTPSTTEDELLSIPHRGKSSYCPYLRLWQQPLAQKEWLVNGELPNGAHFPLCVFTHKRSAEAHHARVQRRRKGKNGKGKGAGPGTAVAEATAVAKGKGKETSTSSSSSGAAMGAPNDAAMSAQQRWAQRWAHARQR